MTVIIHTAITGQSKEFKRKKIEMERWNTFYVCCKDTFYVLTYSRYRFLLLERLPLFQFERFWFKEVSSKIKRIERCFVNLSILSRYPLGVSDSKKLTIYSRKAVQKKKILILERKFDRIFFELIFYLLKNNWFIENFQAFLFSRTIGDWRLGNSWHSYYIHIGIIGMLGFRKQSIWQSVHTKSKNENNE